MYATKAALASLTALFISNALAWGEQGHQVIANLAAAQLTAKARAEVDRLLALEPGETLQSISTWADEHRTAATSAWHYGNFPRDNCTYHAARDCPDGNCVVGAIGEQVRVLASDAADETRLEALKYVVHFVADVHQPLHAGYLDDKGGNGYQLLAFGNGSNLHELWDSGLINRLDEGTQPLTQRLLAGASYAPATDLDMAHAAEESCRIVSTADFYPPRVVDQDYAQRYTPVLEQRLTVAAARLAGLLNGLFR